MKIVLFGSNGMLGTYLNSYLSGKHQVVALTREDYDLSMVTKYSLHKFLGDISGDFVVINAAGVIKQRDYDPVDMIMVNSVFPNMLGKYKAKTGHEVIHITTDCVFSGLDGNYDEKSLHDCTDYYGQSKSLGEHPTLTTIRTSIIGEEKVNQKSLLEWVRSNKGNTINGYLNHKWNGVTCLQLAKVIGDMIKDGSYWTGVEHVHSPDATNKAELCGMINDVYDLGITIEPMNTPTKCYRDLSSIKNKLTIPTLPEQIEEMYNYEL